MKIVEYIKTKKSLANGHVVYPVKCKDGFEVSCQASQYHYCLPRKDIAEWTHIELGYPSQKPTVKIRAYAETKKDLLSTVYGYVPVELVDAMLEKHGGIVE